MPYNNAVMRGLWMITGLPREIVVVQTVLAQIGDFVTGSLTTTRIDGESDNWTIDGNNVFPSVNLTFSTFGRPSLTFKGKFDGEGLTGQLAGSVPARIFKPRTTGKRSMRGAWTISGLPTRYQATNFILDEMNGYVVGTLSVLDGSSNIDFSVVGNDFRPQIDEVKLIFRAPALADSFTFTGNGDKSGSIAGIIMGVGPNAIAANARLTPGSAGAPGIPIVDGGWTLTGLPAPLSVVQLNLFQLQGAVTGTLDVAVDDVQQSVPVRGALDGAKLTLTFTESGGLPSFVFEGIIPAAIVFGTERRIEGALSGGFTGPASLVSVPIL